MNGEVLGWKYCVSAGKTDHTSVLDAIAILRREPISLALVVDEYGSFEGIVTAADMLEAIVGEISEQEGHAPETSVIRREDGSLLMDGMMSVDDVKAAMSGQMA